MLRFDIRYWSSQETGQAIWGKPTGIKLMSSWSRFPCSEGDWCRSRRSRKRKVLDTESLNGLGWKNPLRSNSTINTALLPISAETLLASSTSFSSRHNYTFWGEKEKKTDTITQYIKWNEFKLWTFFLPTESFWFCTEMFPIAFLWVIEGNCVNCCLSAESTPSLVEGTVLRAKWHKQPWKTTFLWTVSFHGSRCEISFIYLKINSESYDLTAILISKMS